MPKALWDIVWKRLRESHDFLTYAPDGADRVVVPLSELQEDHVERLDDAVKMLASQETQEAYVGVYANRVQRNAYSEMQIKSLAQLTTWGVEGLPQSELTKQMESKGNNFGYVVKVLTERGQIFNKKVTLKAVSGGGAATMTSMLYLTRYKPAVEAGLKMEGGKSKVIEVDGKRCDIQFEDDEQYMRKILRFLNNPNGTQEPSLKKSCMFIGSAGHKLWRRLKQKMIEEGLIREEKVLMKRKEDKDKGAAEKESMKVIIKKIKELEEETHVPAVPTVVKKPPRLPTKQFVELSLDKQLMHHLVTSGTFGKTSAEMSSSLGLNLKKHSARFNELSERFSTSDDGSRGIQKKKVTVGKSSQISYVPSQAVRDSFKRAHRTFFGVDVAEEEPDSTAMEEEETLAPPFPMPDEKLARNELFKHRYVWLCTEVREKGFFLSQLAGAFLLTKETAWAIKRNRPLPKEIDHKTVKRLVDAAVAMKVIKRDSAGVPSKDGKAFQLTVFLPYGKELDEEMMKKVTQAHHESFKNRMRKKDDDEDPKNLRQVNEEDVAVDGEVDTDTKQKSFEKFNAQVANGYHQSKLLRCRDVSELICSLIDERPENYVTESFARVVNDRECRDLNQIVYAPPKRHTDGTLPLQKEDHVQEFSRFEPTDESNKRVFVFEDIWSSMTVPVFLSALGSSTDFKVWEDEHDWDTQTDFLHSIFSKRISDLTPEELQTLAGPEKSDIDAARGHLQEVLKKLLLIGVLRMISIGGSNIDKNVDKNITHYYMGTEVRHQVLWYNREPEGEDLVKFDFKDKDVREAYWNSLQYLFAMKKVQQHKFRELQLAERQISWPVSKVKIDKNLGRIKMTEQSNYEKLRTKVTSSDFDFDKFRWNPGEFKRLAEEFDVDMETCVRTLADAQRPKGQNSTKGGGPGRKSKDRTKSRHKNRSHGKGTDYELPEEEEEQFILLQPETQPPPTRKRKWFESEDRELLRAWAGWVASEGSAAKVKFALMKLPQGIRAGSCNNRLQKLMADATVKEFMEEIKLEANNVFDRHKKAEEQAKKAVADTKEAAAAAADADPNDADAQVRLHAANKALREAQAQLKLLKAASKKAQGSSDIFEIRDNDDMASTSTIAGLIERVVQAAPERPVEGSEAPSSRFDRLSKATPDGSNPLEYFRWLCNYADKARKESEKARGPAPEPSVEVTSAISMILSSLYEVEFMGKSIDSIKALFEWKRFSPETMKGAIKHLRQQHNNLIDVGELPDGQPTLCLSELYKEGTKPPFAPMMLNEDNAAALEPTDDGILWPLPAQRNPLSLAPLLSLGVMGGASFALRVPTDVQRSRNKEDKEDPEVLGNQCLRLNMASIALNGGVINGTNGGPVAPEPTTKSARSARSAKSKRADKPAATRKFEPSEVGKSSQKRKEAKSAFNNEVKRVLGVDAGQSILKAVVDGGTNGISAGTLQSLLEHNNLSADLESVKKIEELLEQYGLVRLLAGYSEARIVDAMGSEHLVVGQEVPLRPWINSEGKVIRPLWESLVLRLVDLTSRIPGIRGDYLVASLKILPPQFAREIISDLVTRGVLHCCASGHRVGVKREAGIWEEEENDAERGRELFAAATPFAEGGADGDYCFFVNPLKALERSC